MAFAQLTYRESLRDIEVCPSAQGEAKLYHMGFREPIRRRRWPTPTSRATGASMPTLRSGWSVRPGHCMPARTWAGTLSNTVYALDSTTIDLCLSVFRGRTSRTTKAAVKMHTLLDLKGNIPSFIHVSDGKLHDVHALDLLEPEGGAIYVMDRGYVDFAAAFPFTCIWPVAFRHARQVEHALSIASIRRRRIAPPASFATRPSHSTAFTTSRTIPAATLRALPPQRIPRRAKRWSSTNQMTCRRYHLCALQEPLAGGTVLQMDQAASSDQAFLYGTSENAVKTQI